MFATLSFVIVSLCGISQALRLPVASRSVESNRPGVRIVQSTLPENVDNARDVVYATNITLGGQEFPIQLDTGSSDVWVQAPFPLNINNVTEIQTNLTFGIGKVQGNVCFADMSLGPYHVDNQAFLNATNATDFGAIFSNNIYGILGLAFDQGSDVYVDTVESFGVGNKQGRTFLGNIFAQDASAPNLFTVLLGRTDDPDGLQEGLFTVSEYEPEFASVANQPKLHRTPPQLKNLTALPRWSVVMDKMTVNGQDFQFNQTASGVDGLPDGSQVTVLDTGFTFSQIPGPAVDFIYSSIPGAIYNETTKLWEVPCNSTTSLEFSFGNVSFPIHPLDISVVKNVGGRTVCQNTFRPINLPAGASTGFDSILGVSFLKNVYASFDFGDWTPDEDTNGLPFVQMLPTTKPDEAMAEFQAVRNLQVFKADQQAQATATPTPTPTPLEVQDSENQFIDAGLPAGAALITDPKVKRHTKRGMMMIVTAHQTHRFDAPSDVAKALGTDAPMDIPKARVAVPIPPFPFPLPPRARPCINAVLASYGPAVLALLAGILFLSMVTCVVGILLLVRFWLQPEGEEVQAYEPMLIKEDVLVVPRDYTATIYHD